METDWRPIAGGILLWLIGFRHLSKDRQKLFRLFMLLTIGTNQPCPDCRGSPLRYGPFFL